jgi:hypothetical protein
MCGSLFDRYSAYISVSAPVSQLSLGNLISMFPPVKPAAIPDYDTQSVLGLITGVWHR